MSNNAGELYKWCWRARRDILALEFVTKGNSWDRLERELTPPKEKENGWGRLKAVLKPPEEFEPRTPHSTVHAGLLPPDEELELTQWKVKKLLFELKKLGDPGDPGDPPLPPYE